MLSFAKLCGNAPVQKRRGAAYTRHANCLLCSCKWQGTHTHTACSRAVRQATADETNTTCVTQNNAAGVMQRVPRTVLVLKAHQPVHKHCAHRASAPLPETNAEAELIAVLPVRLRRISATLQYIPSLHAGSTRCFLKRHSARRGGAQNTCTRRRICGERCALAGLPCTAV